VQQHFDRAPFVHRPVAGGGLVEGQLEVEDFVGVDAAVPDQVDQLRQVLPDGRWAAVQVRVTKEELPAG
jgi:hypothetical protein